jgi:hypothetical protein
VPELAQQRPGVGDRSKHKTDRQFIEFIEQRVRHGRHPGVVATQRPCAAGYLMPPASSPRSLVPATQAPIPHAALATIAPTRQQGLRSPAGGDVRQGSLSRGWNQPSRGLVSQEVVVMGTNPTELDRRHTGGTQVVLRWDRPTGELTVTVIEPDRREPLEVPVAPHEALRAFWHPYAYAAAVGII